MSIFLAAFIAPFMALLFFGLAYPARGFVAKRMKDGWVKRVLLLRLKK